MMESAIAASAVEHESRESVGEAPSVPWPDQGLAAGPMTGLVEEARAFLREIEQRTSQSHPVSGEERMKMETLRFLSDTPGWVDLMDLPSAGLSGRTLLRNRVLRMADDGLLEARRNEVYPNMISVRATAAGLKALRQMAAQKAMNLMRGWSGETLRKVIVARDALVGVRDGIR